MNVASGYLDDLLIKNNKDFNEAVKTLNSFQKGEINPIESSYDFLNEICLGGLLPNLIIAILGRPTHGKTYIASQLKEDILKDKNKNIGLLHYNWEMPAFALLLTQLKKRLHKPYREILYNLPSPEELVIMKDVADEFRDDRLTTIQKSLTPTEFDYLTRKYIEQNLDKEQLFIIVDHVGITKGTNKLQAIYELLEIMNGIKLDYPNRITFIILGQLNREIEKLWRTRDINPINLRITSEYIYGADALQQYADVIIASMIPSRAGLEDGYCTVHRERNPHLEEHIIVNDKNSNKDYVRLKGINRVYYDVLKKRLDDGSPSLYCQILSKEQEEIINAYSYSEHDSTEDEEEIIF
jgi:replicative DNA helicase